jgi:hypothetical protein
MRPINPDWRVLREEFTVQALAACGKVETALRSASKVPPLELGEALENAANEYLDLCDQISALHTQSCSRGEQFARGEGGQKIVETESSFKPAVILAKYFAQPVED